MINRRVLLTGALVSPTGFPEAETSRGRPPRPRFELPAAGSRLLGELNERTVRYRATNNNIRCQGFD
jgi:hypothetical protein